MIKISRVLIQFGFFCHMKGVKQNALVLALSYDFHNDQIDLVHAFTEPLQKVKYPKEISQSILVKINELAALRSYLKISEIIAEKIGTEKYVHLAIDFMEKWRDYVDEKVVNFMKSKIQLSEDEELKEEFFEFQDIHEALDNLEIKVSDSESEHEDQDTRILNNSDFF